jgi:hypothetical protein
MACRIARLGGHLEGGIGLPDHTSPRDTIRALQREAKMTTCEPGAGVDPPLGRGPGVLPCP